MSGVHIKRVWFSYKPDHPILRGINLEAQPGEILGLLGANGAGKTTTFRMLAGLLQPDAGEIRVADVDVRTAPRAAKMRCAYLPDEPLLYPNLSALENLNLFSVLWGVPGALAKTRAEALLHEVGLWPVRQQQAQTYSRGMRQKLALCTALIHDPDVLLMDEPFTGLDIEAGFWARDLLRRFADSGRCVVFTSHTPELVEAIADRIAILHQGRVAYQNSQGAVQHAGGMVKVFNQVHQSGPVLEVAA